ncbi:MAG TPA: ferritin-like domain-containing protein [Gemmatimonadales bacterium]|jgi:demethoxyubiquinone hydroxylase (CLK1/Coq7/Cat5 family)|nr:ferritin-like domain-containing protein [Gemmatimonadales bacterium]
MDITRQELDTLNFYRASELHGGLILGALVRRARDPQLILDLTRHAGEEVMHAQLWTETILALGGRPWPIRDTYQARYAAAVGTPLTLLEVLALTQVFERRVYRHFTEHLKRPATHPTVAATLRRMLEEEKGHLTWVKRWLDAQAPDVVRETMRRYAAADALVYRALLVEFGWRIAA